MSHSDIFRLFVKDYLDNNLSLQDVQKKWNKKRGLFDALKENMDAFPLFGIRISDSETEPDLYISLADNDARIKRHGGMGISVYPVDNRVVV